MIEQEPRHGNGFTLVEVLVALAIAGMALSAALTAISGGLEVLGRTEARQRALLLAETTLARVGHDIPVKEGRVEGNEAGGVRWTVVAEPWPGSNESRTGYLAPYEISVTITWPDRAAARSLTLTGLRVAPRVPPP